MVRKRCGHCEFWGDNHRNGFGCCNSDDVITQSAGNLVFHANFGCIHWKEKKPDVRGRIADYLFRQWAKRYGVTSVEYKGPDETFCKDADEIIDIIRSIIREDE